MQNSGRILKLNNTSLKHPKNRAKENEKGKKATKIKGF